VDETVGALLAAGVGAAAALLGAGLAPVVQSRRAHKQWVRDKRAEQYEYFMALMAEASDGLRASYLPNGQRTFKQQATWEGTFGRLQNAAARVSLYSSSEVQDVVDEVWAHYQVSYGSRQEAVAGHPSDDQEFFEEAFADSAAQAVTLMRKELHVEPQRHTSRLFLTRRKAVGAQPPS